MIYFSSKIICSTLLLSHLHAQAMAVILCFYSIKINIITHNIAGKFYLHVMQHHCTHVPNTIMIL